MRVTRFNMPVRRPPHRGAGRPAGRLVALLLATVLIGTWTRQIDHGRVANVLAKNDPFDEATMEDHHGPETSTPQSATEAVRVSAGVQR